MQWPGLCSSPGGRHPLSCLLRFPFDEELSSPTRRPRDKLKMDSGHCGATSQGVSDCKSGSQGSFGLDFRHGPSSVIWSRAARRCLKRCAECERCNFVSVSLPHSDCSWYHSCDLTRLQLEPPGFHTYRANERLVEPPVCFPAGLPSRRPPNLNPNSTLILILTRT